MGSEEAEVCRRFVAAINHHDLPGLASVLAAGHRFTDSLGQRLAGRDAVLTAWRGYFELVPGYAIEVDREIVVGPEVIVFGTASGDLARRGKVVPDSGWSTPICARMRIERGAVAEWQVYADNEPLRALLRQAAAG